MTFPLRAICVLALAGFVGACQTWARLEPAPLDVAGDYTVEPDIVWSVNRLGDTYHLTVDGPMLQRAVLSAGVGDGEALIDIPEAARERNSDSDLPAYENDMSPIELVEFYKSTLSA